MRNQIIKSVIGVTLAASMVSCGDKWLETDYFNGVESEGALTSPTVIEYALNGTYVRLLSYYFGSDYANNIADVASDITYRTGSTGHFSNIYQFTYQETDVYLSGIWEYGYKVVDNSARIIEACEELLPESTGTDEEDLKLFEAEARCLRAYANLVMVNVFSHQAMVAGQSHLSKPGLVIVEKPIVAYDPVSRSTIGETYDFIIKDLKEAISLFNQIGGDRGDMNYMNEAAAYGFLARAYLYLENWSEAAAAANKAIEISGIDALAYTDADYMKLYSGSTTNWESLFSLGMDSVNSFGANSSGTLYNNYGFSPSPYLYSLFGSDDCRLSLMYFNLSDENPSDYMNNFCCGKFWFGGGNSSYAPVSEVGAPEMFLIQAESYANLGDTGKATEALLVVAKRNPAITSVSDLPSTKESILTFVQEERARELFQEGLRLWDLRRWNISCNLNALQAPEIVWGIKNVKLGDMVYPIPVDEINAGFGVTQNEGWASTRPM